MSVLLEMALGWLLSRENYRCVCPALYMVMVSGRHPDLDRRRGLATGNASESPGLGLRLEDRVRGAFQR